MKNIIFIFVFISSFNGFSQPVVVRTEDKLINLANYSFSLEDPKAKLTIGDVLKKEAAGDFKKIQKPVINFGTTASPFWVKCVIQNETDQKLLIELGNASLTDIQLYEVDSTGGISKHHSGNWLPFHRRELEDVNYQFELAVSSHKTEAIFLRVQHYRGTQFPFIIGTKSAFYNKSSTRNFLEGMYYGLMLLMVLYNLFIYFLLKDISYIYYVLYIFFMGFWNAARNGYAFKYFWPSAPFINPYLDLVTSLLGIAGILFAINFLNTRNIAPYFHRFFQVLLLGYGVPMGFVAVGNFVLGSVLIQIFTLITVLCMFITAYVTLRRGYKPAKFFLIAWSFLLMSITVYILKDFNFLPYNSITENSMQIGSALEVVLLSMALADRINIYKKEKEQAQVEKLLSMEENKKLIEEQNLMLERKVEDRTLELKKTNKELLLAMENLKAAQAQLVQTEKMASLGEVTAGIAHEIQNPLNFINNFSEVSVEIAGELKDEINKIQILKNEKTNVETLLEDLIQNQQKINNHGKRADAIVKGMLQHSRASTGKKELTDINALTDQYFRLSYHGIRAKDKTSDAVIETHFDEDLPKINVIPEDVGRVLLNLFTNAFYSVTEKRRLKGEGYQALISVTTRHVTLPSGNPGAELRVKDNGMGIPQKVLNKIYQPFFSTKPTGQGTGLGLSISFEIVTKVHAGFINVESKEGEFAEFTVLLPQK